MDLESVFCLQQKNKEGVLPKIFEAFKQKLVKEIQDSAINDDFASLYIISLNRNIFDSDFVSDNDFKLNAISEIISIMNTGEGNTEFQNQIINYLMQVKDINFLMYVLDNILHRQEYFDIKNICIFISTLSVEFKASKLEDEEKENLKKIIYKHFLEAELEIQESLIRMLEILKIVDLYETAVLFNKADESIQKKLMDSVKSNISPEKALKIVSDLKMTIDNADRDENRILLFIIALDKYDLDEAAYAMMSIKEKKDIYNHIEEKIKQLSIENLIDENKFCRLLQ